MKNLQKELIATSIIVERLNKILLNIENKIYNNDYVEKLDENNIKENAILIKKLLDKFDEIDNLLK